MSDKIHEPSRKSAVGTTTFEGLIAPGRILDPLLRQGGPQFPAQFFDRAQSGVFGPEQGLSAQPVDLSQPGVDIGLGVVSCRDGWRPRPREERPPGQSVR